MAAHIFDIFMMDGEQIIFTLLIKMIEISEKTILSIRDDDDDDERDLLEYLRAIMPLDCLLKYPMTTLLD